MATDNSSRKVGAMDCVVCGEVMPVKQNGRDTLNVSCPWCGFSAYAKGGTEAHRIVAGWVRNDAAEAEPVKPVAAAKPAEPAQEEKPAPAVSVAKIAKAAFSLGDL